VPPASVSGFFVLRYFFAFYFLPPPKWGMLAAFRLIVCFGIFSQQPTDSSVGNLTEEKFSNRFIGLQFGIHIFS